MKKTYHILGNLHSIWFQNCLKKSCRKDFPVIQFHFSAEDGINQMNDFSCYKNITIKHDVLNF